MPHARDTLRLPALLVIMDGYGLRPAGEGNAIAAASTPVLDRLLGEWPSASIQSSGLAVGLPEGQMGNSEVGHLNIGAGRVVLQEMTRIDKAIEDGSFADNTVLKEAMEAAASRGGALHLMGLVSDGGVHSHIDHLYALLGMAKSAGLEKVFVHAFLDGRDTPPTSGLHFVEGLQARLAEEGLGRLATIMGRYYSMDRDERWDRIGRAWAALVRGEGRLGDVAPQWVMRSYSEQVTDEFVAPIVIVEDGEPVGRVQDGDTVVFFNFRPDRARQLTRAFTEETFDEFDRVERPETHFVCLTEYDPTYDAHVAFPKDRPEHVLADVLSGAGLRQLHIAETEKYAHVTFFLNGGAEEPKEGEVRVLVPSPKVPTYDEQPSMSAPEVTRRLVEEIESGSADVYIVNFANCDMVGHTGVLDAATSAVETVDEGVGEVTDAILAAGGWAFVTSDHGNAEQMLEEDGVTTFTAHTTGEVPFIAVHPDVASVSEGGVLADVAPSLIDAIGLEAPSDWTGRSLLEWKQV